MIRTGVLTGLVAGVLLATTSAAVAEPVTYTFENITHNNPIDEAIGEAQLSMEVSSAGLAANGNQRVDFLFRNKGPQQSTIASIYFDDGGSALPSLLGSSSILNNSDVFFLAGGSPPNLPGGSSLSSGTDTDFASLKTPFTSDFTFTAKNPKPMNGVNVVETVTIRWELKAGKTFSNVLHALNPDVFGLRVGIHVINFATGGSESFVAVPTPTSFAGGMLLLGVIAAGYGMRRRCHLQPTA